MKLKMVTQLLIRCLDKLIDRFQRLVSDIHADSIMGEALQAILAICKAAW
jgi:hypothetical protein